MVGVSFDSVKDNAAFAAKYGFQYPLLCDTDRTVGLAYGAADDASARSPKRISYLIGADGRVEKAWPKVQAAQHPAEVLAGL